jgi:hypothetical protein
VPAEAPTIPPPSVAPPENVAEILRRHGNELAPRLSRRGAEAALSRGRLAPAFTRSTGSTALACCSRERAPMEASSPAGASPSCSPTARPMTSDDSWRRSCCRRLGEVSAYAGLSRSCGPLSRSMASREGRCVIRFSAPSITSRSSRCRRSADWARSPQPSISSPAAYRVGPRSCRRPVAPRGTRGAGGRSCRRAVGSQLLLDAAAQLGARHWRSLG